MSAAAVTAGVAGSFASLNSVDGGGVTKEVSLTVEEPVNGYSHRRRTVMVRGKVDAVGVIGGWEAVKNACSEESVRDDDTSVCCGSVVGGEGGLVGSAFDDVPSAGAWGAGSVGGGGASGGEGPGGRGGLLTAVVPLRISSLPMEASSREVDSSAMRGGGGRRGGGGGRHHLEERSGPVAPRAAAANPNHPTADGRLRGVRGWWAPPRRPRLAGVLVASAAGRCTCGRDGARERPSRWEVCRGGARGTAEPAGGALSGARGTAEPAGGGNAEWRKGTVISC
ncbi:unnamed protein product [Closterium sp. NIES-54]